MDAPIRKFRQFAVLVLLACAPAMAASGAEMQLKSPAFADGGAIPAQFTCQGADRAPALQWHDVPAGAKSLVLIVDDPDAPDPKAPKMTWVHEVVVGLPPQLPGLPEGHGLPPGARFGLNDWKKPAWGGPCPPIGRHRYYFRLFALDAHLALSPVPAKPDVLAAMEGHVLAHAVLIGTYQKR